jgi:hypothetical protein
MNNFILHNGDALRTWCTDCKIMIVLAGSRLGLSRSPILCSAGVFLAILSFAATGDDSYQRPGRTERVSIASNGTEGAGIFGFSSELPSLSADGRYIVFDSIADNLVPNDANGSRYDVFVHDRVTGVTTQVSVSSQGVGGNNASFGARISGDGRYVVFESVADNLVPTDSNGGYRDIFLHDNVTGQTTLVSKSIDSAGGNESSYAAVISRDGRYIAFDSDASNLIAGDTNSASDVFIYDRETDQLALVSVDSAGTQANAFSAYPAISADGHYITFNSRATNLPANPTGLYQVYRHNRLTGETALVSQPTGNGTANASSFGGSISADGQLIAFDSDASNLVPQDDNGWSDVFVHDMNNGTTIRVSVDNVGAEGNGYSSFGRISGDGRVVAFQSDATNLIRNDTDGGRDIFVHDVQAGNTEMVSVASNGSQATFPPSDDQFINQEVWHPALSADGQFVAWDSTANNVVPGDTHGAADVFVRDRGPDLGVGQMSVTNSADQIDASGWVTLPAVRVSQASDSPNDAVGNAAAVGGEIIGAALTYRPEQADLLFAFALASLPHSPSNDIPCIGAVGCLPGQAGAPGMIYGFRFSFGLTNYEVRALRSGASANPPAVPLFALYRCDSSCTEIARLTGSIGSTGNEVLLSLPLETLGLGPTPTLTGLNAYSAIGDAEPGPLSTFDQVNLPDVTIPIHSVSLGIAPGGAAESQVPFDTPASLTSGNFAGTLHTCALVSGSYDVWAKVCLGDTCRASSVPFQLTGPTCSLLVSAASRKTHGSAGTFDVDLPIGGTPGIECRSGGADGDHTMVFTFANTLSSVASARVTSGTGSVSSSGTGADPHQYVVGLTGVGNAQTITVTLTNVTDSAGNTSASISGSMRVLAGDTTADGSVNSADIAQTKSQSGTAVGNSNFREDITTDGNLNSADIGFVKSKSGTALP